MTAFLLRRLAQTVILTIALSAAAFGLMGLMPGDPLDIACQANPHCTPATLAQMQHTLGLDQPLYVRYGAWLNAAAHGDFGYSRTYRLPVGAVLGPRLVNTAVLGIASLMLSLLIAVPLGVFTSLRQNSRFDYGLNLAAFAGISMPSFWLGIVLIIVFAVKLKLLPAGGTETVGLDVPLTGAAAVFDRVRYLVLPTLSLSLLTIAYWVRFVRAKMLEVMRHDFVRTARAKGLPERRVVLRHALRNALIPLVTIVALGTSGVLSGAVITETVFSYQGVGKLIFDAVSGNDYNVAMCAFLIQAAMVLLMNLVADVAYALLDPRITYG